MARKSREPCLWEMRVDNPTHDELHAYLSCAAEQSCRNCVMCSDRALEMLIYVIKSGKERPMASSNPTAPFVDSPTVLPPKEIGGTPSLRDVIDHAIDRARSHGLDEILQYECAVQAVRRIEPDLPLLVAARLINALLEERDGSGEPSRYAGLITRPADGIKR